MEGEGPREMVREMELEMYDSRLETRCRRYPSLSCEDLRSFV